MCKQAKGKHAHSEHSEHSGRSAFWMPAIVISSGDTPYLTHESRCFRQPLRHTEAKKQSSSELTGLLSTAALARDCTLRALHHQHSIQQTVYSAVCSAHSQRRSRWHLDWDRGPSAWRSPHAKAKRTPWRPRSRPPRGASSRPPSAPPPTPLRLGNDDKPPTCVYFLGNDYKGEKELAVPKDGLRGASPAVSLPPASPQSPMASSSSPSCPGREAQPKPRHKRDTVGARWIPQSASLPPAIQKLKELMRTES